MENRSEYETADMEACCCPHLSDKRWVTANIKRLPFEREVLYFKPAYHQSGLLVDGE
jgi:hypothetical protein